MSYEFDPAAGEMPTMPGLDRIDTNEKSNERGRQHVAVRIDYDVCDETGACASVCPEDVFEQDGDHSRVVAPQACTECWLCVENCVSGAIEIG